jgi:hypothetical protein
VLVLKCVSQGCIVLCDATDEPEDPDEDTDGDGENEDEDEGET